MKKLVFISIIAFFADCRDEPVDSNEVTSDLITKCVGANCIAILNPAMASEEIYPVFIYENGKNNIFSYQTGYFSSGQAVMAGFAWEREDNDTVLLSTLEYTLHSQWGGLTPTVFTYYNRLKNGGSSLSKFVRNEIKMISDTDTLWLTRIGDVDLNTGGSSTSHLFHTRVKSDEIIVTTIFNADSEGSNGRIKSIDRIGLTASGPDTRHARQSDLFDDIVNNFVVGQGGYIASANVIRSLAFAGGATLCLYTGPVGCGLGIVGNILLYTYLSAPVATVVEQSNFTELDLNDSYEGLEIPSLDKIETSIDIPLSFESANTPGLPYSFAFPLPTCDGASLELSDLQFSFRLIECRASFSGKIGEFFPPDCGEPEPKSYAGVFGGDSELSNNDGDNFNLTFPLLRIQGPCCSEDEMYLQVIAKGKVNRGTNGIYELNADVIINKIGGVEWTQTIPYRLHW